MRSALCYIMIAIGCGIGGWGFWGSVFWPVGVGEIIAATHERYAVEGGEP